jgi:hypothetical protein
MCVSHLLVGNWGHASTIIRWNSKPPPWPNWDEWWAIAQSWRKFWFKDFMWSTTMPCALARWWCQWWEPSEQLLDALEKVWEFQANLKVIPHGTFCQKLDMTSQMTSCNIQDIKHILKNYNNRINKIYWP